MDYKKYAIMAIVAIACIIAYNLVKTKVPSLP